MSSGQAFPTKVDLIDPAVDLATRTARVRLQIDNQGLALRPGQVGTIELRGKAAEALTILPGSLARSRAWLLALLSRSPR